jgi:hypothetical protein
MAYLITKSIFPEDKERLKIDLSLKTEKYKYPFRLFDADNKLYFEGISDKNFSFEPLDDEMGNSGCTEIKYFNNGVWETL